MKKVLNVLGIIGSMFLTISLTTILTCLVLLLNIKFAVSKVGINKLLKNIDIVETIKVVNDGELWDGLIVNSDDSTLTEEQLKELLNDEELQAEFEEIFSGILTSITGENTYQISKEKMIDIINLVIDKYNNVADVKITEEERKEVLADIDDEFINEINTSLEEINVLNILKEENAELFTIIDFIVFGSFVYALIIAIVIIIALIALLRWSPYKWMPYAGVASIITSLFTIITGLFIKAIPLNDIDGAEFIYPIRNSLSTNFYITTLILILIAIALFVLNHVLKKQQLPIVEETITIEPKEN